MNTKKIVLTGGGTTGHVAVNLALIPVLLKNGWDIYYMGSKSGIERELIEDYPEVKYISIPTGKLRRYFSFENLKDFFRVLGGIWQAFWKIKKIKPDVIFSKGGFVSFPVVIGGYFNRVPSITHESDVTPGLANKMITPFASKVMFTFKDSGEYIGNKGSYIGPVIREQIKNGDAASGRKLYGFTEDKPIMVVLGGSLGSKVVNDCIRDNLNEILKKFNVLHGVGSGNIDADIERDGYVQVEYINKAMNDTLAMADLIVSRAGANAIFEFLYYNKPMLLIPLDVNQSRGDQIINAVKFEKMNYAGVLLEKDITDETFMNKIEEIMNNSESMINAQKDFVFQDAITILENELRKLAEKAR